MKVFKVECICPTKGSNNLPKYLGDLRVDVAATGRYHCQNCSETYEIYSDGNGRVFSRVVTRARLIAVHCEECEKQYQRTVFLGNFQVDLMNQGRFHCKNCNKTFQLNSDGIGNVRRSVVDGIIEYADNLTVIGE